MWTRVPRRVVKLARLLLVADGAEMSLPTTGGTDRGAFSPLAALPSLQLPSPSPAPPSYSIPRAQIVANVHGLPTRKRSLSGDSQTSSTPPRVAFAAPLVSFARSPSPAALSAPTSSAAPTTASLLSPLRCQLPAPPSAKRLRREPLSPTSVGEVSDAKKLPPAKAATPGAAQMQSMLRGLQHLSTCSAGGCANPLCVSSRAFVDKVKAHRASMKGKASHDEKRCGACKLWGTIVRAHAPTCSAGAACLVPGCPPQQPS
ncbi:uncharacterized protein IUM83_08218 [Phytophthora cinnamomi]|uniref:uncharacterized protein n=1 Tax=Phytophthora cinnamomi TaxID=4785 RepID=UPI00355A718B|nr:hypothetical protein IUM83_08218 [Phytophthora cinnamomi]